MTEGLAKTRGSLLKEVLQELEGDILEPFIPGRQEWAKGFKKGYLRALEDVWERMNR